jgi:endonuclease/exonuclease/phosphatase family metal-dependent hydrolase
MTGYSEFVAKRAFKAGSLHRANLDTIPMVILGDLNADYTPTGMIYGDSEGHLGQRVNTPGEVLENAGMLDAREERPGAPDSVLTPEEMEDLYTLTDPEKKMVNDYIFYKWRKEVSVKYFTAMPDPVRASDHKRVSVTLQFSR